MTMTTIFIHLSHDDDIINETLNDHPDFTIDLNSNPHQTPITAPKTSLIPFLLAYYYDETADIILNHPQITQSDIDLYLSQFN
jgi:hypothetical protein